MRLFTSCSSCENEIWIKPTEHSRYDLSREKGSDEFIVKCEECGRDFKVHVNDVYAVESNDVIIISIIAVIVLGILFQIWFLLVIPFAAIGYLFKIEKDNVATFNKFRL